MRSYLIDEISPSALEKVSGFLHKNAISSNLDQIFWVQIPEDLLSRTQFQHHNCQPYVFAVELGSDWVKLEFFVRSLKSMRCMCSGYSTAQQERYIISLARSLIEQLDIKT